MKEQIDFDFIKNAACPQGDDGREILNTMNENHSDLTNWGFGYVKFGTKVLDIGCGGGAAIAKVADISENSIIYGCDISPISIKCSAEKNKSLIEEGRVFLKESGVSDLDYCSDKFDTIYSIESLYFWPNQQEDLKEVYRILKNDGTFMTALEMVGGKLSEKGLAIAEHLDMNCPTEAELEKLLKNAGFSDVNVYYNEQNNWICGVGRK